MGIVLESRYLSKGHAAEALDLLLEEAFVNLSAFAVYNDFESSRIAALKAHLSAGF